MSVEIAWKQNNLVTDLICKNYCKLSVDLVCRHSSAISADKTFAVWRVKFPTRNVEDTLYSRIALNIYA